MNSGKVFVFLIFFFFIFLFFLYKGGKNTSHWYLFLELAIQFSMQKYPFDDILKTV